MTPCSSGIISLALANDFLMRDFHFLLAEDLIRALP
jgi:hypothetical protein